MESLGTPLDNFPRTREASIYFNYLLFFACVNLLVAVVIQQCQ